MAEMGGSLDFDTIDAAHEEEEFLELLQRSCQTEEDLRGVWARMAVDVARGYPWTLVPEIRERLRKTGAARMLELKGVQRADKVGSQDGVSTGDVCWQQTGA